ncbi:pancreatic triacylglycerol lipase-like isoform X1 [Homalodisca vitripennis]|uniref:pancreatic triacylglycerol lipase-like isoform X1 n=2 Tax=Homalodisca vitripennis TaxID=197043 RepID=UPI001EEBAB8F|nr:pancreatic triacylglycerol lipase-like isoform X1 [Homalodisca vitripennis]
MRVMAMSRCVTLHFTVLALLLVDTEAVLSAMRAAKCLVPNGVEHISRAAILQQCISRNYAQGNETTCYPELGCFPVDSPWTTLLRPFPSPLHPAEINVRLYCYTKESPERYNITLWPDISLEGCPFRADRRTAFITHGFASNGNASWLSDLKDDYLSALDANIFLVDWGQGAELLNYLQVASNTRIVGAELARFVKYLQEQHGLQVDNLHLMGHSLGAQISAYTAKAIPGIYRLTAMDPAQPGFEGQAKEVRLDKDDANFVEVIHTNALPFLPTLGFGLIMPHGHVDFYMNGGLRQPGCHLPDITEIKSIKDLTKFPVEIVNMWVSCSHGRAYEYYSQVLRSNCTIWGRVASLTRQILNAGTLGMLEPLFSSIKRCDADSCIPLGLETPEFKARGVFAATTHKSSPYCETNFDVNSRILKEIRDEIDETTSKITDTVRGVVSRGKAVATGAVDKGKAVASGLTGKLGGIVRFGKKDNGDDDVDDDAIVVDEDEIAEDCLI